MKMYGYKWCLLGGWALAQTGCLHHATSDLGYPFTTEGTYAFSQYCPPPKAGYYVRPISHGFSETQWTPFWEEHCAFSPPEPGPWPEEPMPTELTPSQSAPAELLPPMPEN